MGAVSDFIAPPEWSNWRLGDWGALGPDGTEVRWHGVNCQVYEDGSLGPRPGWKSLYIASGADNAFAPHALVWRQSGADEPDNANQVGKGWLQAFGISGNDDPIITTIEVDTDTGERIGTPVRTVVTEPSEIDWASFDKPTWWGDDTDMSWHHVASLGSGSLVTVAGRVYDTVWTTAGTAINEGEAVDADVSIDGVASTRSPTIAEPYGVRMYYAGVPAGGTTDMWFSNELDYSDIQRTETIQNRFSTTVVDTNASSITMLKEVNNGLLVGSLNGRLSIMTNYTPETGRFYLIQEVGAPVRPWAYALVAGQVFFMPQDGRGVVFADGDGVDAVSFKHLRHPTRGTVMKRGGLPARAIGSPYNQFVLLARVHDTSLDSEPPTSTLEFHNGTWVVGEIERAVQVDYCSIPGGRLGRVVYDGFSTYFQTRDETLNAPVDAEANWSEQLEFGDGYDTGVLSSREHGLAIAVLPELRLGGFPQLTVEGLMVEIDYWKRPSQADGGHHWDPQLYVHIQMLTEDGINEGPIVELSDITWSSSTNNINLIPSDLPDATGLRYNVDMAIELAKTNRQFAREFPAGYGMQIAVRFQDLSIRRIVPRFDTYQWKQYVSEQAAVGPVSNWGGRRA